MVVWMVDWMDLTRAGSKAVELGCLRAWMSAVALALKWAGSRKLVKLCGRLLLKDNKTDLTWAVKIGMTSGREVATIHSVAV